MASGYYPAGAENDPRAPWNEQEPEPVTKAIEYSCTIHRPAMVKTTNYEPDIPQREWDGDGYVTVRDDDDFSDTDWLTEYKSQYRTPLQLIEVLQSTAEKLAQGVMPDLPASYWKDLLDDCKNWKIEDEDAAE